MDTVSVSVCSVHWNYASPVRYVAERSAATSTNVKRF